jgi:PAS domain-containing protein
MNNAEFQVRGLGDPRLALHATSALPAWLWSIDGTRVLWANPVGARIFGAASSAALTKKMFGPADAHRRQVARLARTLPLNGAARLERLRGFGAPLGMLVTCGCARLDFADGSQGVLVTAAEYVGRTMPLPERLQRLVEGIDAPIAVFARDGTLVGASDAARPLLCFRNLSEAGLDDARSSALIQGRVETPVGSHHMVLQRLGHGADIGLVALIAPAADQPIPDYELPAISGEAPAEFALIDEFTESTTSEMTVEQAASDEPDEPDPPTALQFDRPRVEASHAEAPPQTTTPDPEVHQDEPSPYIEPVADEPAPPPAAEPSPAIDFGPPPLADSPSWPDEPSPDQRQQPLRFTWRMDAEGRFSLDPGEFTRLIGPRTAAGFGRPWSEIAEALGLDPDGRVQKAVATGDTWTGITLNWPVDGGGRLAVELSGLPIYDRARNLAGYRGFGVCRDLEALTRLAALRRDEFFRDPPAPQSSSADIVAPARCGPGCRVRCCVVRYR